LATPKFLTSLKPPRLLSTTTTLMVPVLFFFLRGNMLQRYTIFLSHPSHQEEIPVYRGFRWVNPSEMLKPPKSGAAVDARVALVCQHGVHGRSLLPPVKLTAPFTDLVIAPHSIVLPLLLPYSCKVTNFSVHQRREGRNPHELVAQKQAFCAKATVMMNVDTSTTIMAAMSRWGPVMGECAVFLSGRAAGYTCRRR